MILQNIDETLQKVERILVIGSWLATLFVTFMLVADVFLPGSRILLDPRGQQGLLDTGKAALNVVDGIVDYTVSRLTSTPNQTVAVVSKAINQLPVDNNLKDAVNEAAKDCIRVGQWVSDGIVNFIDF